MGNKGRALVAEFLRFNLVGAGTLAVGTLVFVAFVAAGFGYLPALAGDYAAGILFSYYMNKHFTFRARVQSDLRPLSVTVLGYAVTFLLNWLLLALAVEWLQWRVIYAQVGIMLLLAAVNFMIFRFIVFGPATRQAQARET